MHQSIQQTSVETGGLDCNTSTKLTDGVAETKAPWESLLQKIGKFVELTEKMLEVSVFYQYKYVLCETHSLPGQVHPYAKMASSVLLSAYKVREIIAHIKQFSHLQIGLERPDR